MSEWISVKDRLPEEEGEYLALMCDNSYEILYWDEKRQEWYYRDNGSFIGWSPCGNEPVLYWMELPELPEEEE